MRIAVKKQTTQQDKISCSFVYSDVPVAVRKREERLPPVYQIQGRINLHKEKRHIRSSRPLYPVHSMCVARSRIGPILSRDNAHNNLNNTESHTRSKDLQKIAENEYFQDSRSQVWDQG